MFNILYLLLALILPVYITIHVRNKLPDPGFGKWEKILVFVSLMISTFFGLVVYYLGWRKQFPARIKTLVFLFIGAFVADLILGSIIGVLLSVSNLGLIQQSAHAKNLKDCIAIALQVKDGIISTSLQNACKKNFSGTN